MTGSPTTVHLLVASADGARLLELDPAAGTAEPIGSVLPLDKPLAITATADGGWVVALAPEGRLVRLSATAQGLQPGPETTTGGAVPCHIAVFDDGHRVAVSNYSGHTVGIVRHDAPAGTAELSDVYHYGEQSHPHQVLQVDDRLLVCDLGRDGLHVIDPAGTPSGSEADDPVAIPLEDGAGPRDAVRVGPDHLVVALEKANAAAVVELHRDAGGRIVGGRQVDRCAFAGDPAATHPSQILLDRPAAAGTPARVLVLNRGSDQLCVLEVADGRFVGGVTEHPLPSWPMDLVRAGDRVLVACRDADVVVGLDIDGLGAEGETLTAFSVPVPAPNGIAVLPVRHG